MTDSRQSRSALSRLFGCLAALLLTFLVLATTASPGVAADYPLPTTGLGSVSTASTRAGQCVTFTASGFKPGSSVSLSDNNASVGSVTANSAGQVSKDICYGTSATLGAHRIVAAGYGTNGAARTVSSIITVLGAATVSAPVLTTTEGGLPFTGADVRDLSAFGVGLVGVGTVMTLSGRKRRSRRRRLVRRPV